MTDIVERLRSADISGHGSYSALVRDAADEIERLRENAHYAKGTIERLKTEIEQWRKLNSQRVDEIAVLLHRLREAATETGRLRADNLKLVDCAKRNALLRGKSE